MLSQQDNIEKNFLENKGRMLSLWYWNHCDIESGHYALSLLNALIKRKSKRAEWEDKE